jgi:hypothetical protein
MMSIGFLAELITAYQGRDEDSYSIAEQTPRIPLPDENMFAQSPPREAITSAFPPGSTT